MPFLWPCLVAWMNTVGVEFGWLPIRRAWGIDILDACILLSRIVPCILTPVRLQRAKNALIKAFRRSRLPGLAKVSIKVLSQCHILPARALWRQALEGSHAHALVNTKTNTTTEVNTTYASQRQNIW